MSATFVTEKAFSQAIQKEAASPPGSLRLRCPLCAEPLGSIELVTKSAHPACAGCGFEFQSESGIWKTLPRSSEKRFEQFVREYELIRAREGHAATGGDYFLALPYKDLTGRNKWQWKIRSGSFRFLAEKVFPVLEQTHTDGMDILDVGSGNCWLSYRLALRGHRLAAVDLLLNHQDGLGAAHHYLRHLSRRFPRFQAEMNKLPFEDSQFDVAIFNASFHYSEGYLQTLRETLRCLRRPGHVMIVDSPHYERDESGRRMVEEKHTRFLEMYGFRSDSIASREYLTAQTLESLSRETGVKWQRFEPWHGSRWALRPWKARLLGRREPAKFFLFWGSVGKS